MPKKTQRILYDSYKLYEIKFQDPQLNLSWNTGMLIHSASSMAASVLQ